MAFFKPEEGDTYVLLHRFKDEEMRRWTVQYRFMRYRSTCKTKRMRFDNGWLDFVRDNELKVGDVCVFELTDPVTKSYEVRLYHANGSDDDCNIDYESEKDEEGYSSFIQGLESYRSGCLEKAKHETTSTSANFAEVKAKHSSSKKRKVTQKKDVPVLKVDTRQKVFQMATTFKSIKPHFFVQMSPSYVHSNYLYIPSSHSATYFKVHKEEKKLFLHRCKDGEMKTWEVAYCVVGVGLRFMQVRLGTGWKDFSLDNVLQVGDVCVFELTDPVTMSYTVSVFCVNGGDNDKRVMRHKSPPAVSRLDEGPSHRERKRQRKEPASAGKQQNGQARIAQKTAPKWSNSRGSRISTSRSIQEKSALQRANAFKTKYPYFVIYVYHSYASSCNLHIPWSHSKRYFRDEGEENVITLCRKGEGKKWKVKYFVSPKTYAVKLGSGWVRFFAENYLKAGDACVFELVDVEGKVYTVTIFSNDKFGNVHD